MYTINYSECYSFPLLLLSLCFIHLMKKSIVVAIMQPQEINLLFSAMIMSFLRIIKKEA